MLARNGTDVEKLARCAMRVGLTISSQTFLPGWRKGCIPIAKAGNVNQLRLEHQLTVLSVKDIEAAEAAPH
jgi:hypothetical protein